MSFFVDEASVGVSSFLDEASVDVSLFFEEVSISVDFLMGFVVEVTGPSSFEYSSSESYSGSKSTSSVIGTM